MPDERVGSLDERWLRFVSSTQPAVKAHPFLTPVRQETFRRFVDRDNQPGLAEVGRNLIRAVRWRKRSYVNQSEVDAVFWLESPRTVLTEAVLPVMELVAAKNRRVALLAAEKAIPSLTHYRDSLVSFRAPHRLRAELDWGSAWADLTRCAGSGLKPSQRQGFMSLALLSDSLLSEFKRVLSLLRPRVFVTAADNTLVSGLATWAAQATGARTLVLQHGIVQSLYLPMVAQEMALWGDDSRDVLLSLGGDASRLRVMGSPRYDRVPWQNDAHARRQLRLALGLSNLPLFVFFSNGNDAQRNGQRVLEDCRDWLAATARGLKDRVQIAVRLHPNEHGELYHGLPHLRVFKNECDVFLSLAGADAVGSLCSTALLEAVLYDRPVLHFYADGWPVLADNWQRGLAIRVADECALRRSLELLLGPGLPTLANETKRRLFANQGKAAQSVANYLETLLAG